MLLGQFIIIITFSVSLCVRVHYTMSFVYHIHSIRCRGYYLIFLSINFVQLLFESGNYLRVAFILLSLSFCRHRRERSSIEQFLDRQGNLLVVADSLLKLRCHSDTPGVLVHLFTNDTRKGVSGCHGNLCSLSLKTKFTEKRYVLFNFVIRMRFRLSKPVK